MSSHQATIKTEYTKKGSFSKYYTDIYHEGLKEHKHLSDKDQDILVNKINTQFENWERKWEKLEQMRKAEQEKSASLEEAERKTREALQQLQEIDNLLVHTLKVSDVVDWDQLKNNKPFDIVQPVQPARKPYSPEPQSTWEQFKPKLSLFDNLLGSRKEEKIQQARKFFESEHQKWLAEKQFIDDEYEKALLQYESNLKLCEEQKLSYYENQKKYNAKIDALKEMYHQNDANAITEYCELVLNSSKYPDSFPKNFELEYNHENKILVVDYTLPSTEDFPTLNEVKYIPAKKELKEFSISESVFAKMFDNAMYQITLRTLHELFEADVVDALDTVSFNGWVNSVNKATGKRETACILSIQARKTEFNEIDLKNVDPKICFKNLKGVGSSKLIGITPVQPLLQINRTDKRFVNAYSVAEGIDSSVNLASMDWEDFEHLIREIFEKEFAGNGGEVKVTQASRDGGVDAVAFDPDPIRGGKIVIQAKRYTNTVGVSAVRDLYGTVMNEGATKGILVTTADFGPDAYEFAKGKPLTLLNGSNLLFLLEKHGTQARINLKEAKLNLS